MIPSICLDFDGVIANPHGMLTEEATKKYGVLIEEDDIYEWDTIKVSRHMGAAQAESSDFAELWHNTWKRWPEIRLQDATVSQAIPRLLKLGDVDVVTYNRDPRIEEFKEAWLKVQNDAGILPKLNVIYMDDDSQFKYHLDYDIFIDDCPHIVVGAHALGRLAIVRDRPWNRGVIREGLSHIHSLYEAVWLIKHWIREHE